MKNNQGKTPQQQKDSSLFTIIGYCGLLLVTVLVILSADDWIGVNNEVQENLKTDPLTPQDSLEMKDPSMIYLDTTGSPCIDDADGDGIADEDEKIIVDTLSRWEGKEGKTGEWGEYVPDSSDEHVMWIGGNGDTIWE